MTLLQRGHAEGLKAAVHRGMQIGAGVCACYNAAAWLVRREPHLATNTVLYALLYALEAGHVAHHQTARNDYGTHRDDLLP